MSNSLAAFIATQFYKEPRVELPPILMIENAVAVECRVPETVDLSDLRKLTTAVAKQARDYAGAVPVRVTFVYDKALNKAGHAKYVLPNGDKWTVAVATKIPVLPSLARKAKRVS